MKKIILDNYDLIKNNKVENYSNLKFAKAVQVIDETSELEADDIIIIEDTVHNAHCRTTLKSKRDLIRDLVFDL